MAIRAATRSDLPAIGRLLAAAFADDPVMTWIRHRSSDWDRDGARMMQADAATHLRIGQVWVDDDLRAAALWAPPGVKPGPLDQARMVPAALGVVRTGAARGIRLLGTVEKHRPAQPHWYLAVLGTHPDHQGHGLGRALSRHVLDRADAEGQPAYLESSKKANVPFYRSLGFVESDDIGVPGSPRLWPMWREPAS